MPNPRHARPNRGVSPRRQPPEPASPEYRVVVPTVPPAGTTWRASDTPLCDLWQTYRPNDASTFAEVLLFQPVSHHLADEQGHPVWKVKVASSVSVTRQKPPLEPGYISLIQGDYLHMTETYRLLDIDA